MSELQDFNQRVIHEFRANQGRVSGPLANMPVLLLTTTIRQKAKFPHDSGVPGLRVRGGDVSLSARGA